MMAFVCSKHIARFRYTDRGGVAHFSAGTAVQSGPHMGAADGGGRHALVKLTRACPDLLIAEAAGSGLVLRGYEAGSNRSVSLKRHSGKVIVLIVADL